MNKEIKPTYVSFEQAKWLKEIGFDEVTNTIFMTNHITEVIFENINGLKHSDGNNPFISRPEQWEIIEWLRVNHGIWVEIHHIKTFGINRFHIIIWKYGEGDYHTIHCDNNVGYEVYDTPQEAYSAAFDYILNNNLI
jgi:hypothetical protein